MGQQEGTQTQTGPVVESLEVDAEHLVGLALVPRRAGPQAGRTAGGLTVGHPGAHEDARQRAPACSGVHEVADKVKAGVLLRVRLIDRGQPVKEVETLLTGRRQRGRPLLQGHVAAWGLVHDSSPPVSRPVASGLISKVRVTSPAAACRDPAYLARMVLVDNVSEAIFSCRRTMPCSSASGRGGQPGT